MTRAAAVRSGRAHQDVPNEFAVAFAHLNNKSAKATVTQVRKEKAVHENNLIQAIRPAKKRTRTSATTKKKARKTTNGPRRAPFKIPSYWKDAGRYHLTQKRSRIVYITSNGHLVYRNNGKLVPVHPKDKKLHLTIRKSSARVFNLKKETKKSEEHRKATERKRLYIPKWWKHEGSIKLPKKGTTHRVYLTSEHDYVYHNNGRWRKTSPFSAGVKIN